MGTILKISGTTTAGQSGVSTATAAPGGASGVHALTADRAQLADRALTADYAEEAALAAEAEDLTDDSPVIR